MSHHVTFDVRWEDGTYSDDAPLGIATMLGDGMMNWLMDLVTDGSISDPSIVATLHDDETINDETGAKP